MKPRFKFSTAFTLIELMISIAMVVILMLGITKVFSLTSQTASATNQVSAQLRDARAVAGTMAQDFANALGDDAPCMILHSTALPAFRNKLDRDGDRDYEPEAATETGRWAKILTVDVDGNNTEGESGVAGEVILPAIYNNRNHRLDTFSFFTRQRQKRQTGGNGTVGPLIDSMTSNEAWVWYGHLWLPNNDNDPTKWWPAPSASAASETFPGRGTSATNPNNYYATQWILGRMSMLLNRPGPVTHNILDLSSVPRRFFRRDGAALPLSPLCAGAYDADHETTNNAIAQYHFEDSRYDLAGTNIDAYRLMLYNLIDPTIGSAPNYDWWRHMMGDETLPVSYNGGYTGGRFKASPFIPNGIDAESLSKQSPIMLPGCTQFIVEYAGDFLKQDTDPSSATYGQIINAYWQIDPPTPPPPALPTYLGTPAETDGQVDFKVTWIDANNNHQIDATEATSVKRQVRWYGMPRDTSGDGTPRGWFNGAQVDQLSDVVPLRDVVRCGATTPSIAASAALSTAMGNVLAAKFERAVPNIPTGGNYADTSTGLQAGGSYNCAWSPTDPKPKMIRITMTIDDPGGKLAEGQTFQFVFTVP